MGGFEELLLVGGEVFVGFRGAPFVLDSRRELVPEDVVGVALLGSGGVWVGGEVEEEHPVSVEVFDGVHVVGHMGEEDGAGLGVPSLVAAMASSRAARVTAAKKAWATVML